MRPIDVCMYVYINYKKGKHVLDVYPTTYIDNLHGNHISGFY